MPFGRCNFFSSPPLAVMLHLRFAIYNTSHRHRNGIQLYLHGEQHYGNMKWFQFLCRFNGIEERVKPKQAFLSGNMFSVKLTCWFSSQTPWGSCVPRGEPAIGVLKGHWKQGTQMYQESSMHTAWPQILSLCCFLPYNDSSISLFLYSNLGDHSFKRENFNALTWRWLNEALTDI